MNLTLKNWNSTAVDFSSRISLTWVECVWDGVQGGGCVGEGEQGQFCKYEFSLSSIKRSPGPRKYRDRPLEDKFIYLPHSPVQYSALDYGKYFGEDYFNSHQILFLPSLCKPFFKFSLSLPLFRKEREPSLSFNNFTYFLHGTLKIFCRVFINFNNY